MSIDQRTRLAEALVAQAGDPTVAGLTELDNRTERVPERWSDPIRAGMSYYRLPDIRMPRGRIELLQNGENALEMIEFRSYQSLRQLYGSYHSANQIGDWQRTDPFLGILHGGGLPEFDGDQLHELKWHHRPGREATVTHRMVAAWIAKREQDGLEHEAAILAVMPQLDGFDLEEHVCQLCPNRLAGNFATQGGLESHRSVMHKENVQIEGTRDAVAKALSTSGANMDELVAALTQLVAQMAKAQQIAPEGDGGESAPDTAARRSK